MSKYFVEIEVPEQKSCDGLLFPGVLSPNPSLKCSDLSRFVEFVKEEKGWVESLLLSRGAILFRDSPVETAEDFNQVVEAFGYDEFPYLGGLAPRTHVVDRVYTANDSHNQEIPFHHEMAYLPAYPKKLFFYCLEEPKRGGETPIVVSNLVYEKMNQKYPEFVEKLEKLQVIYTRELGEEDDPSCTIGRSWQSTFNTTDKSIAEERAAGLGYKLDWIENGVKFVKGPFPAIRVDETRGRKTWFNGVIVVYAISKGPDDLVNKVTFGDGSLLPDDIICDCHKIMEEESVAIPWKKGDILLIDNLSVLHSRRSFDPPRRILASLYPGTLSLWRSHFYQKHLHAPHTEADDPQTHQPQQIQCPYSLKPQGSLHYEG